LGVGNPRIPQRSLKWDCEAARSGRVLRAHLAANWAASIADSVAVSRVAPLPNQHRSSGPTSGPTARPRTDAHDACVRLRVSGHRDLRRRRLPGRRR
jgi:hypothetical protein